MRRQHASRRHQVVKRVTELSEPAVWTDSSPPSKPVNFLRHLDAHRPSAKLFKNTSEIFPARVKIVGLWN